MKKRQQFTCWQCEEQFGVTKEYIGNPKLQLECPFCGAECVVELAAFRNKPDKIYRGTTGQQSTAEQLNLPDVIATRARGADESDADFESNTTSESAQES